MRSNTALQRPEGTVQSLFRELGQLRRIGGEPKSALLAAPLEGVPFPIQLIPSRYE
jgi:hypothetical protein